MAKFRGNYIDRSNRFERIGSIVLILAIIYNLLDLGLIAFILPFLFDPMLFSTLNF